MYCRTYNIGNTVQLNFGLNPDLDQRFDLSLVLDLSLSERQPHPVIYFILKLSKWYELSEHSDNLLLRVLNSTYFIHIFQEEAQIHHTIYLRDVVC